MPIEEWQVGYARFFTSSSSSLTSTHPFLTPPAVKNLLGGTWMPAAAAASITVIYERSYDGTDNAVLFVSFRSKILEAHYISKMHFSWPQTSSISEFPARGSKAVFLSYKDSVGQMQKFALRFSAINEAEKFMNVVKETMGNGSPPSHQCFGVAANAEPAFPPSFTQLMNSYCPSLSSCCSPSPIIPFDASLLDDFDADLKTQFWVEYARFINSSSSALTSTHPSLIPPTVNNNLRWTWISTAAAASITIIHERSSNGTDNAVLFVSLWSKILEAHYISKMHFSWPQISSMSELPARGSRAVFLSYKDSDGQMQKFALRFSATDETERFMNVIKEIIGNGSSEADAKSFQIPISKSDRQCTQSIDDTTQLMPLSSVLESSTDSTPHEWIEDDAAANAVPFFPPSFTELMNSYCPSPRSPSPTIPFDASLLDCLGADSADLKAQFLQYLERTSFKDLLATVEEVINELGDDIDVLLVDPHAPKACEGVFRFREKANVDSVDGGPERGKRGPPPTT